MYETFTVEQPRFGKPRNPDFLLNPGELLQLFKDWELIHSFEGIKENPRRAVAQLLCRKPGTGSKQRAASSRQRAAGSGQRAAGSGQRAAGSGQQIVVRIPVSLT